MSDTWRYTAKSVTKYDPLNPKVDDWIGFWQIGKMIGNEPLMLEQYLETENKYIAAATYFLKFHQCEFVEIRGLEKNTWGNYNENGSSVLTQLYNSLEEGAYIPLSETENLIRLILRQFVWCGLFCNANDEVAVRFGYDFYMYFNSNKNYSNIEPMISSLGLFLE